MAGIAVATAALVVVMSVFNGFHSLIESRLSLFDPPLTALPASGKTFAGADSLANALESLDAIAAAYPVVEERALAVMGERQSAVRLYGIPPGLYPLFDTVCIAGVPWRDFYPGVEPAVISVGAANELLAPIGTEQLLGLYVPRRVGRINPANPMSAFRSDSVAVSAAFALNQPEYDHDAIFVPLSVARPLLQYTSEATSIYLYPAPGVGEREAMKAAAALIGPDGRLLTRMERRSGSFQIVNIEKWTTFLLLGFILIIASFNIISSLSLLIIEKRDNASTLAALGLTAAAMNRVYLYCGMMITAAGGIAGILIGSILSLCQQHFGWVKLAADPSALSVTAYPVEFHPADLLPIILLIAAIGAATAAISTKVKN